MSRHILDIRFLKLKPHQLPLLAPGVRGILFPGDELVISLIHTEIEGQGFLSAYLDELAQTGKSIRFECVINKGFAAGLLQRGYEWDNDDMVLRRK